jgi:lysophospholipase L1-like esterase
MTTPRARVMLAAVICLAQFGMFEVGLRMAGSSEAALSFQRLFMADPVVGFRLRPSTSVRFTTSEFSTDISINAEGVRDAPLGTKTPGERRIVVLGDSLVMAVQVPIEQTFCRLLQDSLNAKASPGVRYRVINAGVQGYGPDEEALFFEKVASHFQPDLVVVVMFVANDAIDAFDRLPRLRGQVASARARFGDRLRRVLRRSAVMQIVGLRVREVRERFRGPRPALPDRRLLTYATSPPNDVVRGLAVSREAVGRIAAAEAAIGGRTAVVLAPARFQLDPEEFMRMEQSAESAGYRLDVDAATERFREAMAPLGLPVLDLLPAFRAATDPRGIFLETTVHLTPAGHRVAADTIESFLAASHLVPISGE